MPKEESLGDGAGGSEYRGLTRIIDQLRVMKKELLAEKDEPLLSKKELANMDGFQRNKHELNRMLTELREDAETLAKMRENESEGKRSMNVIQQMQANHHKLVAAKELWQQMQVQLQKDEKALEQKKKKALPAKELQARWDILNTLAKEIKMLADANSRMKPEKKDETRRTARRRDKDRGGDDDDEERGGGRRSGRRKGRRRGRKGGDDDDDGGRDEADMEDIDAQMQQMSEKQQAFMDRKDAAYGQQDELLDDISKGLDELKKIGTDINKELKVQNAMLDEVDKHMDKNITNLKNANTRLKEMLEESGGLSRWCPMLICFILLLAIVGYIISSAKVI